MWLKNKINVIFLIYILAKVYELRESFLYRIKKE